MKIVPAVCIFIVLAFIMSATSASAVDFSDFTKISGDERLLYKPSADVKLAIVYVDMDGDNLYRL